jgi:hypothetical protein
MMRTLLPPCFRLAFGIVFGAMLRAALRLLFLARMAWCPLLELPQY